MHNDLVRVESAVTATASGDLTWERWTLDCAVALGWAGKRNPLGFAIVRYLTDAPNSTNVWNVVLQLATLLQRQEKVSAIDAKDAAWKALDIWNNSRCPTCQGRGVLNIEQATCLACNGTGRRQASDYGDLIKAGVSALVSAEAWMEGQLAAALKKVD